MAKIECDRSELINEIERVLRKCDNNALAKIYEFLFGDSRIKANENGIFYVEFFE